MTSTTITTPIGPVTVCVDDVGAVTAATMQLSEPTDGQCGGGFRR